MTYCNQEGICLMTGVIKWTPNKKTEAIRYIVIDGHSIFLLYLTATGLPQCKKENIFSAKAAEIL